MKKILSVLLSLCMMFALLPAVSITASAEVWDGSPALAFAGGNGLTEATAFEIATAEQLALMADKVNNYNTTVIGGSVTYGSAYYKLTADIELNDWTDDGDGVVEDGELSNNGGAAIPWTPTGNDMAAFEGNFDGNGHTVSGIYINSSSNGQGLFGRINDATVKNLGVTGSYISGGNIVGGVTGGAGGDSRLENCYNAGSVSGSDRVGGIAGEKADTSILENCNNSGRVTGGNFVGGIAGYNNNTLRYSYNTGIIRGADYAGGITGSNNSGRTVEYCYNAGDISCDYDAYYGKYVDWTAKNDIIGGYGNNRFGPDDSITREQMAAILYRFAGFLDVLPGHIDIVFRYPDSGGISSYAKDAALYCQATGVVSGRDGGMFAPRETAARAEVAAMLQRFIENMIN